MKTNDNIKSIKLIGIIIVLLLIVIIGLLAMPRMTEVREKAFRVEATKIVDAAKSAMNKFNNKELELKDNGESCHKANTYCFTVSELENIGVYNLDNKDYIGKIIVDYEQNINKPQYYLYLKKSADLKIINGFREDYVNMGSISYQQWLDEYETCDCK